jgi:large subunit ribosomal protein L30
MGLTRGIDMAEKTIKIKLVKSTIGVLGKHKKIVSSMGFRKLNQVIERPDNPCIRGMIQKINHLVKVIGE